ncbi:MAG: hypothetical protein R3F54_21430 [Alphaproteobacteria bacterium]
MSHTHPDADLVRRILHAESYPFARPACSYLFEDGAMSPLPKGAAEGRIPVIASGSNASPARLLAKFGLDHSIPVTRAELSDFAVVFAGHFTAYGAIPATLAPHPGARAHVWITWLTAEQLTIMHRSEGVTACREVLQRYDFVELDGILLHPERLAPVTRAGAYLSRRMLAPEGEPLRFAEMTAGGSRLRAHSHRAALRHAARLLEPEAAFHAFMEQVLASVEARQALFERLTPYTLRRADHLTASAVDAVPAG